jgi:HSP20 family molecular chaperone IbpA
MNQTKDLAPQTETAAEPTTTRPVVAPAVDIYENEHEYLVLADLPGVPTDGVRIRFENGELSLDATRQAATTASTSAPRSSPPTIIACFASPRPSTARRSTRS